MSAYSTVAIVGRMNVGKSTLFNRLSSSVKGLTLDYPGVTRDVLKDRVTWRGKTFELLDTGGINLRKSSDELVEKVRKQVVESIEHAQLVLLVIDGSIGVTHEDREVAHYLHSLKIKTILVVNKSDRNETQERIYEANALGFRDIILVSAQHGRGIDELLERITDVLPDQTAAEAEAPAYRIMLLGRPNVGKSSLMNALLNYERSIVSAQPGTTREPVTESISFYKESLALTDSPGIRRKRGITTELEKMMIKSAFQSLKDTDLVALLIDATQKNLVDQDLKLAFYSFEEQYKSLVILINKYDLATPENQEELDESFKEYKHLIRKVPVLRISAKTGKNVGKVLPLFHEVWQNSNREFTEAELTALFNSSLRDRPLVHTKHFLALHRAFQIKKAPITIVLEVYNTLYWKKSHVAFFENLLRKHYQLLGAPIRLIVRARSGTEPKNPES